jgi:hypothetical protein|tara:strand:+ start:79 stop:240 length:162 start_codon:yes stop_codon:yes gene_type:complete
MIKEQYEYTIKLCGFRYKGKQQDIIECESRAFREDLCRQHHYYKIRGRGKNRR